MLSSPYGIVSIAAECCSLIAICERRYVRVYEEEH